MPKIIQLVECRGSTSVAAFIPFTALPQECKGKTFGLVELDTSEVAMTQLPNLFKLEFQAIPSDIPQEEGEDHGH